MSYNDFLQTMVNSFYVFYVIFHVEENVNGHVNGLYREKIVGHSTTMKFPFRASNFYATKI